MDQALTAMGGPRLKRVRGKLLAGGASGAWRGGVRYCGNTGGATQALGTPDMWPPSIQMWQVLSSCPRGWLSSWAGRPSCTASTSRAANSQNLRRAADNLGWDKRNMARYYTPTGGADAGMRVSAGGAGVTGTAGATVAAGGGEADRFLAAATTRKVMSWETSSISERLRASSCS